MKTVITLLCACLCVTGEGSATEQESGCVDYDAITFISPWVPAGRVTLSHGEYREPAAPGSASETVVKLSDKRAFGNVKGKEAGAVILFTTTGGTGTFYDLALLTKGAEGWVNTDTVLLGDRVNIHAIEIRHNYIVVNMTTHGPNDPLCCPTLEVEKVFTMKENRLVPEDRDVQTKDSPPIVGPVWQWEQTLYNDGKKIAPSKANKFTIQFLQNGTLKIKADCNLKGGVYSIEERKLSIEITHSTMAACREGSLEDEFVRNLAGAVIFFMKNGYLYLDLEYDTGTMKLSTRKEK